MNNICKQYSGLDAIVYSSAIMFLGFILFGDRSKFCSCNHIVTNSDIIWKHMDPILYEELINHLKTADETFFLKRSTNPSNINTYMSIIDLYNTLISFPLINSLKKHATSNLPTIYPTWGWPFSAFAL